MGRYSFTRQPGKTLRLVRAPEVDDVLRHDDLHALQQSASATVGAVMPLGSSGGPRPALAERRGRQVTAEDESHRAALVGRAAAALADEQERTKGSRR